MTKTLVFAIVMIVAIATSRVAAAQVDTGTNWGPPAIGCYVANTTTAHAPVYDATHGEIHFASGDTGTYHLVCPMQSFGNSVTNHVQQITVYYHDDAAKGCSITGLIRYHGLSSSGYGTAGHFTATNGIGQQFTSSVIANNSAGDWDVDALWLDITVSRTSSRAVYCGVINVSGFGTFE